MNDLLLLPVNVNGRVKPQRRLPYGPNRNTHLDRRDLFGAHTANARRAAERKGRRLDLLELPVNVNGRVKPQRRLPYGPNRNTHLDRRDLFGAQTANARRAAERGSRRLDVLDLDLIDSDDLEDLF